MLAATNVYESYTCRVFSLGRNGVFMNMNASMQIRASAHPPVITRSSELRLMDTESQTALTGSGLSGLGVRREDSRSAWPDAWLVNCRAARST